MNDILKRIVMSVQFGVSFSLMRHGVGLVDLSDVPLIGSIAAGIRAPIVVEPYTSTQLVKYIGSHCATNGGSYSHVISSLVDPYTYTELIKYIGSHCAPSGGSYNNVVGVWGFLPVEPGTYTEIVKYS